MRLPSNLMLLAAALLAVACLPAAPPTAVLAPKLAPIQMNGNTNPDSMPPSCRVHGGSPPVPSGLPRWTAATLNDRWLDSLGRGRLMVHVTSARTGEALKGAAVSLERETEPTPFGSTVSSDGWARIDAPLAGRYALRVLLVGISARVDPIWIRRGRADTLTLVVGNPWMCRM
jgi:hypothetical protein